MRYHHHHESSARQGFTIIELITTFSILLVMLGLINFIFRDTQAAVQLGVETGETIGAQRGIANQLRADFGEMVGPHQGNFPDSTDGGGVLVLTQKLISDVNDSGLSDGVPRLFGQLDLERETLEIALPTNNSGANAGRSSERRHVRSDQIGFIRNRGSAQPIGPLLEDDFTARRIDSNDRSVDYGRIWYGHLLRTQPNGEPPASNALGSSDSQDQNPLDWLFGRHMLFLDDTVVLPDGVTQAPDLVSIAGNTVFLNGDNLEPNAPVRGYDSTLPSGMNAMLRDGLTDYAYFGFENDPDLPVEHPRGSLVGANNAMGMTLLEAPNSDMELDNYRNAAVANLTFAGDRLRANPTPPFDTDTGDGYETWQIAQSNAIVNDGVSDFAVEFAADLYGVGDGGGRPGDPTDNVAQSPPDTYNPDGVIDRDRDGNVAWYTWENLSDPDGRAGPPTFAPAAGYTAVISPASFTPGINASTAFVWRHDRYDPGSYDVANDRWSETSSATDPADPAEIMPSENVGRFCDWPYLIRIRYRLHDPKGQIAAGSPIAIDVDGDGDQEDNEFIDSRNGIWFEQILPVNRPIPERILP